MFSENGRSSKEINSGLSDEELVASIQGGKGHLFSELYERYATKVFYRCLGVVKDKNLAQDLAHDVFVKVFSNLSKYRATSDFSFWINAITYNHCISYLRSAKRLRFEAIDETNNQEDDGDILLHEKLVRELQISQLDRLLKKLKPEEEVILMMRYQDGMQVRQIATILGIGESAVKMRLKRGRQRLAELYKTISYE
ncbi:RNA polymerase sigma factor [Neolewinella persica]|uniref:RNA polymerase sigma factor n=1 Tax=Neolewinella persica TaxID=70998 RepID=UPI00035E3F91|nr:sigma-70 family RNA polymerase sigma factor [Neolewinella persica]